ncbi:MAG: response regulator [Spirulinaceae cyanobacterium]
MSKILVIEDSPAQRTVIAKFLGNNKFNVTVANNGADALEQISSNRPDLVLLDIVLPQYNGYEVCRRIKLNPETKDVLVVLCSSKINKADLYWGMKQGADAYITKPFQPRELLMTIRDLLQTDKANELGV